MGLFILVNKGLAIAQTTNSGTDSLKRRGVLCHFGVSGNLPLAQLSARFPPFLQAHLGAWYLNRKNWMFGIEMGYFFSDKPKEDPLKPIRDPATNQIIGEDGTYAEVTRVLRGVHLPTLKIGRIFPVKTKHGDDGTGVMLTGGVSLLQHWHYIQDLTRIVPQLREPYIKGYDRYTLGPALHQSIGWQRIAKTGAGNYSIALDFMQGFTRNQRYSFDMQGRDKNLRYDLSVGLRVSWILPILGTKESDEFFY